MTDLLKACICDCETRPSRSSFYSTFDSHVFMLHLVYYPASLVYARLLQPASTESVESREGIEMLERILQMIVSDVRLGEVLSAEIGGSLASVLMAFSPSSC